MTRSQLLESTVDTTMALYRKYADDLRQVRAQQRRHRAANPDMRVQLDDLEAEITYLRLREQRPREVVEIGCLHGWSTTWILRALRDNGRGSLRTFDRIDDAARRVPADLAQRWTFVRGDVRNRLADMPASIDYLFLDAAHNARFARWYVQHLLAPLEPGTLVSVHDVFHSARPLPFSEGSVLLRWLQRGGIEHFTASPARSRPVYVQLMSLRAELGLTDPVHSGRGNPMLFYAVPDPR